MGFPALLTFPGGWYRGRRRLRGPEEAWRSQTHLGWRASSWEVRPPGVFLSPFLPLGGRLRAEEPRAHPHW